jgi:hypothetical protein
VTQTAIDLKINKSSYEDQIHLARLAANASVKLDRTSAGSHLINFHARYALYIWNIYNIKLEISFSLFDISSALPRLFLCTSPNAVASVLFSAVSTYISERERIGI